MNTKLIQCLGILFGFCLLAGCASQDATKKESAVAVPNAVREAFNGRFSNIKRVEWKLKADRNYEAEFIFQDTEIAAKFDASGKWLETESSILLSKVPQAVRDTVARTFKDYRIVETQIVERCNELNPIYELHLDNQKEIVKAQFSAGGQILNQSQKPKP